MTEPNGEAEDAARQPSAPGAEVSLRKSGFRREALTAAALAVLALAAYAPIGFDKYEFLNADDDEYVTENPQVKAGLTGPSLWWALTKFHSHNWHPLTWMSLQLDWQFYGSNASGFHVTNVLLHAANTALLFLALRSLTGATGRSAIVAALFAVHPLHVESVAWVSERKDVLSTLFWMLTLWAYSAYVSRPGWGRYLLTLIFFALGLTAKPMLVTLPCVLLLLDFWPLCRFGAGQPAACGSAHHTQPQAAGWWIPIREKLPFFALVAGSVLLTLRAQQDIMQTLDSLPLRYRLANTPLAYLAYIGMMFWPMRLAIYYPHPGPDISFAWAAAATVLLLILTALALGQARRRPYLAVGWLWYLGTLVPVIGLIQVARQSYADRYTYVPLIGLFLLLVWGAYDLLGRRRLAWAAPVVVGLVAACLVLTWRQLPVWRNSAALWQYTLAVSPSSLAHENMARFLEKEGRIEEARREYAEGIRFGPSALAYNNVGHFLIRHGWTDEALQHFAQSLELYPDQVPAHYNIARIRLAQGKLDEAQRHLAEVIRLNPNYVDGRYYLGVVLERQGKFPQAERELMRALRSKPDSANARYHLGVVSEGQGRSYEAAKWFDFALQSDPNHAEAHTSLGALLALQGRLAAGREHFHAALKCDPRNGRAHFNLALALALEGQHTEARRHFADAVAAVQSDAEASRLLEAGGPPPSREQFRVLPYGIRLP